MKIYQDFYWKDVDEEKIYKLLEDFSIFHCETHYVWEDFFNNIVKDENDNLIFIDLDEASDGGDVDIDFSNDVLQYFLELENKSKDYYAKIENNFDVSPCEWVF